MLNSSKQLQTPGHSAHASPSRYMLWVDGVGGYLLCLEKEVTIGGPNRHDDKESTDVALLANLARHHASIIRTEEGYLLEAHSGVRVADRLVEERAFLNDGYEIILGETVKLRFRLPTVLSTTATLDFLSDHRPTRTVDGVILMEETCLLGPGRENHIQCPGWNDSVLLYRKNNQFCLKSQTSLLVGGRLVHEGEPIEPGAVVNGPDFCFRVELIDHHANGHLANGHRSNGL